MRFDASAVAPSLPQLRRADGPAASCNCIPVAFVLDCPYTAPVGRHDKLLVRFRSRPKDFTFGELRTLLRRLGYLELTTGKTGGSRVAFHNTDAKHIIRLHRPHPAKQLEQYQVEEVLAELVRIGAIRWLTC